MSKDKFENDLDKFVNSLFGNNNNKKKTSEPNDTEPAKEAKVVDMNKKPVNGKKIGAIVGSLVAVFAIILIIISNLYVVKENEYKVIRQFGEVIGYKNEPGLNFKIPFIQTVTTLPKNVMIYDMATEEEIMTADKKRIIVDNYAVWKVTDPKLLISNARTIANAEARMEEFIYSTLRTELGTLTYESIINEDKSSRGDLNKTVTERVNLLLTNDKYGIEVVDVRIRRTDLPAENEQSVFTRMISERESMAQKYLSEGDAQKRSIEANTDRTVTEMVSTAEKEAALIRAQGEAEAAKIYNQAFSKDPEFYELFRTLETYKQTIGEDTMIIIPSNSPYARILSGYLE
ncbi:protease modulator HflC [Ureibacillus manganicus]|uniref:Protein HflC n=1 Tax=Ureibacillus manganicus DSM 26584 TaxID=1384049 RepID=A0A0A3HYE9_9BACL|nr:protease modulator HflC [Ureibacillus manganicus]KGR77484.1 tail fiber protein [Ureibacillus manganicus DSM 26584]